MQSRIDMLKIGITILRREKKCPGTDQKCDKKSVQTHKEVRRNRQRDNTGKNYKFSIIILQR